MQERSAVERVIKRMRDHHERATGSQPTAKDARFMEERVKRAAQMTDNRKKRK